MRAAVTALAGGQRYDAWTQDSIIPGDSRPGVFDLEVPDNVDELYVTELAPLRLDLGETPVIYVGGNAWRCSPTDVTQLSWVRPHETLVLSLRPDRRMIQVFRSVTASQCPPASFAFGRSGG